MVGISNILQKELFVQIIILLTRWFDSHFLTVCKCANPFFLYHELDCFILFLNLCIFRTQKNPLDIEMCKEVFQETEL